MDRAAYLRDVQRGAEVAYQLAELQEKQKAGQITESERARQAARFEQEQDALRRKWGSVTPRVGVEYVEDVFNRARVPIATMRGKYQPPRPVPPAQQPGVYTGRPQPQPEDNSLTPEQRRQAIAWIVGFVLLAGVAAVLWAIGSYRRPEAAPVNTVSDTYGTADYAPRWTDMPNPLYPFRGVFFGKSSEPDVLAQGVPIDRDNGAPICSLPENHSLIVARTRTGKGTRVIVPTLLRYVGSMLVIDPKGENAAITARARQSIGPVHVLNPWGALNGTFQGLGFESATYNPLDVLDRGDPNAVAIAQTLATTIVPSFPGDKDRFWQGSAANVLTAVLLWITDQPGEQKTLARAREITSLSRRQFTDQFMAKMAASSAFDGAIREMISPYLDLAQETYSGIMSNLNEATKFLSDPQVKRSTAASTFRMQDLIERQTTVYVVIPPDRVDTQKTWLRLLITAATSVFKLSPLQGRPDHRTMFLIDEFPALGRMPDLPRDIATMSGYGVDYTLIVQGLDQLRDQYKDSAGAILSNCAFKWFCNVNDLESAKYLSESLGKKTVRTHSKSVSRGTNPGGATEGESETEGETGRNLLNPDEVLNLGRDVAIVLNPVVKPHYVRPVDYWNLAPFFGQEFPDQYGKLAWDPNPYIPAAVAR